MKNDKVVNEVLQICSKLGVAVDTKIPDDKNKYLSAWAKAVNN